MKKFTKKIASYCLSNNNAIVIYDLNEFNVKWSLNDGRINTSKVRWEDDAYETPFFKAFGRKIVLNDCMLIN